MKTNELRIGNYVQYNLSSGAFDDDTEQIPLKIITIGAEDWAHNYVRLDDGFNNSYDFDEIIPIHLTEEWLRRFGFKDDNYFIYLNRHEFDTDKISFDKDEGYACIHVMQFRTHLKHIKFVHQLQNLFFALTGEELSIKD